ncbi:hypothetical protein MAUB_58820 [Mycolicibacterium aubagnense]|uniref:Secreted protein n=1 Tax=Mycolicibacterium aubagnense TaxID=319707 RepID=A0ABN5Z4M6_9MYCO|nr:hypothetical protein MAUB_58820 [Mycolicibacterium aubagnense]
MTSQLPHWLFGIVSALRIVTGVVRITGARRASIATVEQSQAPMHRHPNPVFVIRDASTHCRNCYAACEIQRQILHCTIRTPAFFWAQALQLPAIQREPGVRSQPWWARMRVCRTSYPVHRWSDD